MNKLLEAAENGTLEYVENLKDRNRGMILLLLEKIAQSGNKEFIQILKEWQLIEYNKLKTKIQEVIDMYWRNRGYLNMNHKQVPMLHIILYVLSNQLGV